MQRVLKLILKYTKKKWGDGAIIPHFNKLLDYNLLASF
jgi:hypothetical protein